MSYRGIKRVLGESNLERKIRIWFGICLLVLIATSFLWVNGITENLIRTNTLNQAIGIKPDFILRTHLRNAKFIDEHSAELFKSLATDPAAIPYEAEVITIPSAVGRNEINPTIATDPNEIERLNELIEQTLAQQNKENKLKIREIYGGENAAAEEDANGDNAKPDEKEDISDVYIADQQYVYYTPIIFKAKSKCMTCHWPVAYESGSSPELASISKQFAASSNPEEQKTLELDKLSLAPQMWLRITMGVADAKYAQNKNRAILITVAIATAVFSVLAIWLIVRYAIVKPLAHLHDVTEQVSHGRMDVRAELNTGDEFEELSRSFNRMLRHLHDTQLALQGANNDLDNKVDEQAQLNLKLYEMNQVKSEFLANMSHELRTPLNSIIGYSELLESGKGLEDKQKRFASHILNNGRALLELITDILDLAKLEAGKMEVKPTEFKIYNLVSELCDMLRSLADIKKIQLISCAEPNLPLVYQDKIKVRQVLTNLLSNAIKFTPEGGRISVTVERDANDKLVIMVADTGVGIAEADQQIIFEKFRQGVSAIGGDALTREVSGTGLGLSIVKELCILLGGEIRLESEVGKGSTFTVILPWNIKLSPRIDSEISQSINEITKVNRVDFTRANIASRNDPTIPTTETDPSSGASSTPIDTVE